MALSSAGGITVMVMMVMMKLATAICWGTDHVPVLSPTLYMHFSLHSHNDFPGRYHYIPNLQRKKLIFREVK